MPRVKAKLIGRVKRAKKHDQGSFIPVEDLTAEQLQNFSGLSLILATTMAVTFIRPLRYLPDLRNYCS